MGDFFRDLDLSWAGFWQLITDTFGYYYYVHGWKAILVLIAVLYVVGIMFPATRHLASLTLNNLFRWPFDILRDVIKGVTTASSELTKLVVSSVRESRGKDND